MNMALTSTMDAEFISLTGKEFDVAIMGVWSNGDCIQESWMLHPEIKYYLPRSPLIRDYSLTNQGLDLTSNSISISIQSKGI